ncbi:ABC transporter ATP-binding protein [Porphyromonas cangingivalis]|uniref:ABC transporter ATP-binding protein n=1 Tax=Porphyromonas cangingivalis TaxID=36874 RepID=UPI00051DBBCE|nr:ATP-binding cassette domain-containing protein [Porphyromonas cangingivalis]KGL49343.1 phosphonate ABC transporter ATP-binding protein [Porphyromonas cangingivalis]
MIEVKSVEKKFDTKEVLRGIDASFKEGECSLVIGKSGAGKTVLLKTVVGLIPPDKGEVLYNNTSLYDLSSEELKTLRQQVGMLFQGSALFDSMTIFENIMFPLDMFSTYKPAQRIQIAKDCIERVKLYDARYKYPAEVSGGMMKRAAIARAIALGPKYLFCDEPNSGLDPETSRHIDELIHSITKESNITTIINTHDMKSVTNIGDHVIFVNKGRIAWEGRGADIHSSDNEKLKNFVFVSEL